MSIRPFHLAFPIHDVEVAREFYVELLGCGVGRESEKWIDFDLGGHQVVGHVVPVDDSEPHTNDVDGDKVPASHFGVILEWSEWEALRDKLVAAEIKFRVEPHIRFKDKPGEQGTMFFDDPFGNSLEFKTFRDDAFIFATR